MSQFVLSSEDKKQIVLYELIRRPLHLRRESISSFLNRVMRKYHYAKGSDRYFWKAIKELEKEGKLTRTRQGKTKMLSLTKKGENTLDFPVLNMHLADMAEDLIISLRNFI